jgi:hypothetical protein
MDLPRPTTSVGTRNDYSGGPLGVPDLCCTVPDCVRRKDYGGEVLG